MAYQLTTASELPTLRKAQLAAATPEAAGLARKATSAIIEAAGETDPVLVMNFGIEAIALNKHGLELVDETVEDAEEGVDAVITSKKRDARRMTRGWHVDFTKEVIPGSVPTNKMIGDLRIPCGVVLVVGGASTAKTPMVHALASAGGLPYATVRYGEPLAGYIVDPRVAAISLGQALIEQSDIVFDSIKDLLAYAPGGAMASGLSRGSLPVLSDLSAMASSAGCTIYIPMNPSTPDANIVEMIVEAAKSNVAMVLTTVNSDDRSGTATWTALSRRGEGLRRDLVTFNTKFDADSILHLESQNKGQRVVSTASVVSGVVGVDALDGLLRRHSI